MTTRWPSQGQGAPRAGRWGLPEKARVFHSQPAASKDQSSGLKLLIYLYQFGLQIV